MPGGKIQLTVRNAQDKLLTGNPDISFFKSVFKRYTDFQTESMKLEANTDNVKLYQSKTSTLKFKINNNNGDLINHLYLNLQMPTIYSDKASSPTAANHAGRYEFQWIKRLGEYIIKDCKFIIDGEVIDNLTGEWLHIWSELTIMSNKWGGYNEMIGHEGEMFNPKSKSKLDNYPNAVDINPGDGKFYSHSIRGRRIVIPLPFWFTHNLAQAFPTYLLEGQEIELEITLRPLNELYTLLDQNISSNTKKRFKPSTNSHKIGHFINRKGNFHESLNNNTVGGAIGINPFLEIGVVYLGGEERAQLQKYMKQEYLITQVAKKPYKIEIPDNINTFKHEIGLTLEYPTSKIAFCARRSDFETEYLQYENYTNKVSGIDPFAAYNSEVDMNPFEEDSPITTTTLNNQKFGENILSAELYFRGIKRFEKQDMSSFSLINNYQHSIRIPIDGVYTYSFETQNLFRKYQPNGACDMSMLMSTDSKNEIIQNNNRQQNRLELTLAPKITTNGDYHYNFMLFSMNYNILKIGGGRAELLFNDSIYRDSNHHKSLKTVRDLID